MRRAYRAQAGRALGACLEGGAADNNALPGRPGGFEGVNGIASGTGRRTQFLSLDEGPPAVEAQHAPRHRAQQIRLPVDRLLRKAVSVDLPDLLPAGGAAGRIEGKVDETAGASLEAEIFSGFSFPVPEAHLIHLR